MGGTDSDGNNLKACRFSCIYGFSSRKGFGRRMKQAAQKYPLIAYQQAWNSWISRPWRARQQVDSEISNYMQSISLKQWIIDFVQGQWEFSWAKLIKRLLQLLLKWWSTAAFWPNCWYCVCCRPCWSACSSPSPPMARISYFGLLSGPDHP